jgi:5-methylcytosine-specific restriction endonuclease McrA
MNKAVLFEEAQRQSPYIDETGFDNYALYISKLRTGKEFASDQIQLFNMQSGICEYCGQFIIDLEEAIIHHIVPLGMDRTHKGYKNKRFIHKDCHKDLHQKYG